MLYNNTTKKWERGEDQLFGIVYISPEYIERGFFNPSSLNVPMTIEGKLAYLEKRESCTVPLYWDNCDCCYTIDSRYANNIIINSKGTFHYPIQKCYNFSKLHLKAQDIKVAPEREFAYIQPFTFGLEYETSGGNIPWLDCIDNNLVPLYDGSIGGHEYVTFPLTFIDLPIIKNHLALIDYYTKYDKNCALHIHFGNFPINEDKIKDLCKFWYYFQWQIGKYIPEYSYYVEKYKDNGKAYNKPFPAIQSLNTFYHRYTGNEYENVDSFYLPNLFDSEELRKWEVNGRYFNMNIMHLISGSDHKTVEFRFLRPTTNYSEIKWYILVLSAFLTYVIKSNKKRYKQITVNKVIDFTFPKDIASKLKTEGTKLYHLRKMQVNYIDFGGLDLKRKKIYLTKILKFNL